MAFTVERDWITGAGLRAVVIFVDDMGHRCGYVGVPSAHALHGKDYDAASSDGDIEVHGGLTYSGGRDGYPAASDGLWWFGYDCAHYGDARDAMWIANQPTDLKRIYERSDPGAVERTTQFCVAECESLATQLAELP